MIVIDTNSLIVLIVGLIDTRLINKHKRTSIYDEQDYNDLLSVIEDFNRLVVLPNVWTEVDNLLKRFTGEQKYSYVTNICKVMKDTSERFIESIKGAENNSFYDLGLTDTLLLELSKECDFLITSDSGLSDFAIANGIKVYDIVKNRNERL